jgi:hypothetical protein
MKVGDKVEFKCNWLGERWIQGEVTAVVERAVHIRYQVPEGLGIEVEGIKQGRSKKAEKIRIGEIGGTYAFTTVWPICGVEQGDLRRQKNG